MSQFKTRITISSSSSSSRGSAILTTCTSVVRACSPRPLNVLTVRPNVPPAPTTFRRSTSTESFARFTGLPIDTTVDFTWYQLPHISDHRTLFLTSFLNNTSQQKVVMQLPVNEHTTSRTEYRVRTEN